MGDIRNEWRINDIERKVNDAQNQLYKVDEVSRNMASLEHSMRSACSCIDDLRVTVEGCITRIEQLEQRIVELESDK